MTEKINLNNLDKSNWQRYRFDQIAKNISERVDPNNTDLNIYVGLEHIDSESLHITRTGTADDVNGQKLRFYPGDIIFGRRRAYQRKAAIATTDGFCSAHALVLRANPDVIDPKLFPFFMHSDQFMHRAVDISVGSLSPTINWGTLKHQEFLLPPKEQQAELAELLWATDLYLCRLVTTRAKLNSFFYGFLDDVVSTLKGIKTNSYRMADLGDTFNGLSGKNKSDFGFGKPFITYMNVYKNSQVNISDFDLVNVLDSESQNLVQYGDILFTGSSETPHEVGKASVMLDHDAKFYLNSFCFGFRLNDFKHLHPEYARHLLQSKRVRNFMRKHAQGSTRFNLSKTILKNKLTLELPPIDVQLRISAKLTDIEIVIEQFDHQYFSTYSLYKVLINQVF